MKMPLRKQLNINLVGAHSERFKKYIKAEYNNTVKQCLKYIHEWRVYSFRNTANENNKLKRKLSPYFKQNKTNCNSAIFQTDTIVEIFTQYSL